MPIRLMTKGFKQMEEKSSKQISELKIKYEMANDDRKADKVAFDKRLNQLIRDFVNVYKKLANEFKCYKEFTIFEIDIFKAQLNKKQQIIETNMTMVKEY